MTESDWKVVIDREGMTISSELFTLNTHSTDPMHLEAVVSELQRAIRGTYGQYCGLSRAVEMVGERWGILIIRDLIVSKKSATELHQGLPKISAKLLGMRLKEMEYSGIIRLGESVDQTGQPRYELTEYGRALEPAILAFGRWGAVSLAMPRPEDIVTDNSLTVAIKATFMPEKAADFRATYELHIGGHVIHAKIDNGAIDVAPGPLPGADAVLDLGFALRALLTGEATVQDVLDTGQVSVVGDPALLTRFVDMFQIPRVAPPRVPA